MKVPQTTEARHNFYIPLCSNNYMMKLNEEKLQDSIEGIDSYLASNREELDWIEDEDLYLVLIGGGAKVAYDGEERMTDDIDFYSPYAADIGMIEGSNISAESPGVTLNDLDDFDVEIFNYLSGFEETEGELEEKVDSKGSMEQIYSGEGVDVYLASKPVWLVNKVFSYKREMHRDKDLSDIKDIYSGMSEEEKEELDNILEELSEYRVREQLEEALATD